MNTKILRFLGLLTTILLSWQVGWGQDLIITGVYDGPLSGGTPKGVELYVVNNITDLSIYGLGSANNGGGTDGEEFTFPAVAATAGDFIYVASEATQFTNFLGFAPDYTDGAMGINGDDAIELFQNGSVIDVFGDINVDGSGEAWEYLDGWAYRNNGTGPDGTSFTLANWFFSGPNALDGESDNATASTPFPLGTYSSGAASNDTDTEVYENAAQPVAGIISSTDDTPGEAVDVFNFYIEDQGSADGLPTVVTNIRITPAANNTADWTDHIQGVTLSEGLTPITTGTPVITDTHIDIPITAGDLNVADGAGRDLTLAVYLNTSNIVDLSVLAFQIAATNDNLTADASGSDFASNFLLGDVVSNDFTIDVFGTELAFTQQPSDVVVNTVMSPDVLISSVDENGNLDTEFDGSGFDISISSTGTLAGTTTLTQQAVAGVATFNDIEFTVDQTGVTITATDASGLGLTGAVSDLFDVTAAPVGNCFDDDFADLANDPSTSSSYTSRSWTSTSGVAMTATNARRDQTINGVALTLNDDVANTYLEAANVSGGIGELTVTTQRVFGGGSGNLTLEVNGSSVATIPYSGTATTHVISGINVSGTATVRILNNIGGSGGGGADRVAIDDLSWTCYTASVCTIPIAQPTNLILTPDSDTEISGTFTTSDADSYLVIASEDGTLDGTATDGVSYTAGASFAADETVVGVVTTGSFTATGLTPGTEYTFFIIAANAACTGGPLYLTTGPLSDAAQTAPADIAALNEDCKTPTSATLSWDAPAGNVDGYILLAREGALDPFAVNNIGLPATQLFDLDYSAAPDYTGDATEGVVVYNGTATSVTVTGLTAGVTYTFEVHAYAGDLYSDNNGSDDGPTNAVIPGIVEVSNELASPADGEITVSWTEPIGPCYDEILVVANELSGISFTPSGSYIGTANPAYAAPDQVVFAAASGTDITVTGLTNGTTYYFEIFVRSGSDWSAGVEVFATPTILLFPGDLVVIGFDNNIGGGDDRMAIATMVDLPIGTSFTLANAVYELGLGSEERNGQWVDCTGNGALNIASQRVTLNTFIPSGSVLCFDLPATTGTGRFITNMTVNGSALTAITDYTVADNGNSGTGGIINVSTSRPDVIFLMQGTWDFSAGTYATFDGRVLGGIQEGALWYQVSDATDGGIGGNSDLNRRSRIPEDIECLAIQGTSSPGLRYTYYNTTAARTGTQRFLLGQIIDFSGNWVSLTGGSSDDDLFSVGVCDANFTVSALANAGIWVGGATGDADNWFNCQNWENYQVPDTTIDVSIALAADNPRIDESAPFADRYELKGSARDLTIIAGMQLLLETDGAYLVIDGELTIEDGGELDASNGSGNTATIELRGNWTNQSTGGNDGFTQGTGSTVIFNGTAQQTLVDNNDTENFANAELDNAAGLLIQSPMDIQGQLTFTNGILTTASGGVDGANLLDATLACLAFEDGATYVGASDASHVDGVVEFNGTETDVYNFPVGDGTLLHRAILGTSSVVGADAFRVEYFPTNPNTQFGVLTNANVGFVSFLEYWQISPLAGSPSRSVELQYRNPGSNLADPNVAYVVRWGGTTWEQAGGNGNIAIDLPNTTITSANVNGFSPFTFADNGTSFPVELLTFKAYPVAQGVGLEWRTAQEINNDYFVVERSLDGVSFAALGRVAGMGTTSVPQQYGYTDVAPVEGLNFYRLKQVDFDGSFQYSEVLAVDLQDQGKLEILSVYPNPVEGILFLEFFVPGEGEVHLEVFDAQGKQVPVPMLSTKQGRNQLQLSTAGLSQGVYLYRVSHNGNSLTGTFMKQ